MRDAYLLQPSDPGYVPPDHPDAFDEHGMCLEREATPWGLLIILSGYAVAALLVGAAALYALWSALAAVLA